jgi:hypothetical protein
MLDGCYNVVTLLPLCGLDVGAEDGGEAVLKVDGEVFHT